MIIAKKEKSFQLQTDRQTTNTQQFRSTNAQSFPHFPDTFTLWTSAFEKRQYGSNSKV